MADKRKRVFGQGKTGGLYIYGARALGFKVAQQYAVKALTDVYKWSANYQKEVLDYARDADRVDITGQKLAHWYELLQGAIPQIKQLYDSLSLKQKQWVGQFEKQLREKMKAEEEVYVPPGETVTITPPAPATEETIKVSPTGKVTIRETY